MNLDPALARPLPTIREEEVFERIRDIAVRDFNDPPPSYGPTVHCKTQLSLFRYSGFRYVRHMGAWAWQR